MGKPVMITIFVDANLMADLTTGISHTRIIHLMNKTLIEWKSKSHSGVKSATYVSEYDAAYICTDHIVDLCNTLFYIGVPIHMVNGSYNSWICGDSLLVFNSTVLIDSKTQYCYHILNYHLTKESQAEGIIKFVHMNGNENNANTTIESRVSNTWFLLMKPIIFLRDM